MAGPTTEAVNDEVKELRADFHRFETAITADVRELSTQVFRLITAIRFLALPTLASEAASTWWGVTLTTAIRNVGLIIDELRSQIEPLRGVGEAVREAPGRLAGPPSVIEPVPAPSPRP